MVFGLSVPYLARQMILIMYYHVLLYSSQISGPDLRKEEQDEQVKHQHSGRSDIYGHLPAAEAPFSRCAPPARFSRTSVRPSPAAHALAGRTSLAGPRVEH